MARFYRNYKYRGLTFGILIFIFQIVLDLILGDFALSFRYFFVKILGVTISSFLFAYFTRDRKKEEKSEQKVD